MTTYKETYKTLAEFDDVVAARHPELADCEVRVYKTDPSGLHAIDLYRGGELVGCHENDGGSSEFYDGCKSEDSASNEPGGWMYGIE